MACHDTASHVHDTTLRYGRPALKGERHAREGLAAGGECRDTKFCIVTGARAWPLGVVSQYSLCIMIGGRSG